MYVMYGLGRCGWRISFQDGVRVIGVKFKGTVAKIRAKVIKNLDHPQLSKDMDEIMNNKRNHL